MAVKMKRECVPQPISFRIGLRNVALIIRQPYDGYRCAVHIRYKSLSWQHLPCWMSHDENLAGLDIVELRSSLIEGWKSSAPEKWSSDNVLYSHRGGLAIWEYEQCLLDVIEAVSHQSGAPQPATTLIGYVPRYQKRMFNNRTFGALSIMAGSIGAFSLISSFPPSPGQIPIPIASIALSVALMKLYQKRSPPPEIPFNQFY